jgi:hypothetical protein
VEILPNEKGRFLPGPDNTRHNLTHADRVKGFWAMLASICERYPAAVSKRTKRHMSCNALPALIRKKSCQHDFKA